MVAQSKIPQHRIASASNSKIRLHSPSSNTIIPCLGFEHSDWLDMPRDQCICCS